IKYTSAVDQPGASLRVESEYRERQRAVGKRSGIIPTVLRGQPREPHTPFYFGRGRSQHAAGFHSTGTKCCKTIGRTVLGVEFCGSDKQFVCPTGGFAAAYMEACKTSQVIIVGNHILRWISPGTLKLGPLNGWLNGTRNTLSHMPLKLKYIVKRLVEAISPN